MCHFSNFVFYSAGFLLKKKKKERKELLHKSNHVVFDKGRESTVAARPPPKASPSTAETEMAPNIPRTAPEPSPSRSACCCSCLWILSKGWQRCLETVSPDQGRARFCWQAPLPNAVCVGAASSVAPSHCSVTWNCHCGDKSASFHVYAIDINDPNVGFHSYLHQIQIISKVHKGNYLGRCFKEIFVYKFLGSVYSTTLTPLISSVE